MQETTRNNASPTTPQLRAVIALQRINTVLLEQVRLMLDMHHEAQESSIDKTIEFGGVRQQMPLWKVIEGCVLAVSQTDDFLSQNLSFDLDLNSSSIIVDTIAFERLVSHLLQNAAQHSPHRGRISISCARSENRFELRVSDEGSGIEPAILEKVFSESCHNPCASAPDKERGLPLCAKIVEDYGGTITCTNLPRAGAQFTVGIPIRRDF